MELSYIINHLGEDREGYRGSVAPPVMRTSNFCFPTVAEMQQNIHREFEVPFYTRGNNPTVEILRVKMAALEGCEDALITASGCAAITTAVFSQLRAGDHAVYVRNAYSWANTLFSDILPGYGVSTTEADGTSPASIESALQPQTRLIYLESPTSFMMELQDLAWVASLARQRNIVTIADNSYSTPLFQQPAKLGIDIVVHSASKYLGGHSDVVGGVICSTSEVIRRMFGREFLTFGGICTPDNAWLILRGLRTLELRMNRVMCTATKISGMLASHPMIEKVLWPFSEAHPQSGLARKQMKGAGGLMSVILKTHDPAIAFKFCDRLRLFLKACSWGGYESLVFPAPVLASSANNNKHIHPGMVRLYLGLEDPELLAADLDQALSAAGSGS